MSVSLDQLSPGMKKRLLLLIPVALLLIAVLGYLTFIKPSKEKLISKLDSQLREEKFEQLYEEAGDNVRLNVTKEKFVQRMKKAVTKLKAIDENLNFQRDMETERALITIDGGEESSSISAFQKLEKDGKSVVVAFYWTSKGDFFDMWVSPRVGTPEEYQVYGVSYKHLYSGNHMLE